MVPQSNSLPATSGAYSNGSQRPKTIKVAQLNHYFGEGELRKQALYNNHLEVRRGEIVIMTGPSGSGKTTLLTLIGTLRTVQEGSLKVLGHELNGATRDDVVRLRRELGFIFQAHNLIESLTAFQNVNMAAELQGLDGALAKDRIDYLLNRLGLGHRIHYKPKSLSGGQKQRVAIARGLVHQPKLVLADEPTAALDEQSGREVVTLFQELAEQEGCTIIMVTHDNRILDVADRIVNMVDGRIRSDVAVHETSVICAFLRQFPLFADLQTSTLTEVAD
jgi:putative ABC transport system ATP-binding protein